MHTLYTQCLSIRDWLPKFSDCSCDWQMSKNKVRVQKHATRVKSARDSDAQCLNPFRRWSSVTRVKVGFRISAKCAGSAAMHSTVLVSLSHMNTIWSNTAGCAVRTP